jgi:hypothetical protein
MCSGPDACDRDDDQVSRGVVPAHIGLDTIEATDVFRGQDIRGRASREHASLG